MTAVRLCSVCFGGPAVAGVRCAACAVSIAGSNGAGPVGRLRSAGVAPADVLPRDADTAVLVPDPDGLLALAEEDPAAALAALEALG